MTRILFLITACIILSHGVAGAAYHHGGDTDSDTVLKVYPTIEGTKLDSCALCHSGGQYEKNGKLVELGSCQWCHYSYGYDASGEIDETLNGYGRDYSVYGKDSTSLEAIDQLDSDGDGFSNQEEIAALRYPGNDNDDPTKVSAPFRVMTRGELEALGQHSQLMLMNTHKSGDFYARYTGVVMADLLDETGILPSATGLTVFAPDGWAQYHPLNPDSDPLLYHVYGGYPQAQFYYHPDADEELAGGWCNYASPLLEGLANGDLIDEPGELQLILAYARDGAALEQGRITAENKLDGEGPFRVVPPQKIPGPPDQSSKATNQQVIWPFDNDADHNAGFSTRSATVLRVEPLPAGTTDVDLLEAGWAYVDEGKVLIYGAIDPLETLLYRLDELGILLRGLDGLVFSPRSGKKVMMEKVDLVKKHLLRGHRQPARAQINAITRKTDGCVVDGAVGRDDWVDDCSVQRTLYWAMHELTVLLAIEQ